ncbi:MAG: hypothetical protein AAFV47_11035 [Pseudomonadota bacterium]
MLFRVMLLVILVNALNSGDSPGATNDEWEGLSLVSGFPSNIEHKDFPYNGRAVIAVLTSFQLNNTDVLRGEHVSDGLSFSVQALNEGVISKDERIFLLLDVDDNDYEVIYWAPITPHVCFPKETVSEQGIEKAFYVVNERDAEVCTNAFWY